MVSRSARNRSTTRVSARRPRGTRRRSDPRGWSPGADLGAQRGDRLLPLGLDLGLAVLDDPLASAWAWSRISAMIARPAPWPPPDARRLVPGVGELLLELGELGVGLGLLGLGRLRPPSMALVRSANVFSKFGTTHLPTRKRMPNTTRRG